MRKDTEAFVNGCLLSIITKTGNRICFLVCMTAHATQPGSFLHFDYLYVACSSGIENYTSVLKDDLCSYSWIERTSSENAENAALNLLRWTRVFTALDMWISDQRPWFISEELSTLDADCKISL